MQLCAPGKAPGHPGGLAGPAVQLGDPVLRPSTPQRALGWGPAAAPWHMLSFHFPFSSKGTQTELPPHGRAHGPLHPEADPHRLTPQRQGEGAGAAPMGAPRSTSLGAVQGPSCLALDTKRGVPLGCVPWVYPRPLRGPREQVHLRRL